MKALKLGGWTAPNIMTRRLSLPLLAHRMHWKHPVESHTGTPEVTSMSSLDEEFRTFRGYSLQDEEQYLTPSMEDYLEMLFRLDSDGKPVKLGELSSALNVQPPSATRMAQRLHDQGYVRYEKYGTVELTPRGLAMGKHLLERHNLIESFLRLLGVSENTLKDTERIEHIISDELVSRMAALIQYAKIEPEWLAQFLSRFPPGHSTR
jgi:DtxR family Mn-dependent transcriptional regulator